MRLANDSECHPRRTFKDIITFIPFVIILIIPLSPIGHVLVFGAIQRFFPDFFPSCFTEQRQNLLQLYETAEYSEMTINENLKVSQLGLWQQDFSFAAHCPRYLFVLEGKVISFIRSVCFCCREHLESYLHFYDRPGAA